MKLINHSYTPMGEKMKTTNEFLREFVVGQLLIIHHEVNNNFYVDININLQHTMWYKQYGPIKRKGLKKLIHMLGEYIIRKTTL